MSKTSYTLIAIMIIALIFMGAIRGYQVYQKKVAQWQEERANENAFTFQNVPLSLAAPQAEPTPDPISFETIHKDVFLEEAPLSNEDQQIQAKQTIHSILNDYKDDPSLQEFNKELSQLNADGKVSFEQLSTADLSQIIKSNPEIRSIVSKHMQNPDFSKLVQQILTNPQFADSVKQLQNTTEKQEHTN